MARENDEFCRIDDALAELQAGRMVVLVDDEDRENEGDLICAAQTVTPEMVNFMLRYGRGVLCLALTQERCGQLNLHPQTTENTAQLQTAFMVTVDAIARFGVSTGVSASDRATTILAAVADDAKPTDLARPGHVSPLRARDGGVLVRAGQTEGSVDLMRLAGLKPAAALIEIMNEDGTMARVPDLTRFCVEHGFKMCTVADLVEYRLRRETLIERIEKVKLPLAYGEFELIAYKSLVDREPHLAVCYGGVGELDEKGHPIGHDDPVMVRVHSECLTGDIFGSKRCECGDQLQAALKAIAEAGKGAVVYLRQEGRGIGLAGKLHAYKLQDGGMDTVDANLALGFPADRRDYGIGAQIIRDLGLRRLQVLTNNPKKINRLEVYGIEVTEQLPLEIPANPANAHYLRTKKERMGHLLDGV